MRVGKVETKGPRHHRSYGRTALVYAVPISRVVAGGGGHPSPRACRCGAQQAACVTGPPHALPRDNGIRLSVLI